MNLFTKTEGCIGNTLSFDLKPVTTSGIQNLTYGIHQWFIYNKILRIMKLTFIFLLALILNVRAEGYSQKVTYSGENVPIEKVFSTIKKQTGYGFFFQRELISLAKPVTINAVNEDLSEVLTALFKDQPLEFSIKNKTILVLKKTVPALIQEANLSNIPNLVEEKDIVIRGQITDIRGETLPGVSIKIKGTTMGVVTDLDGRYIINVPDNSSILVFTYIGYVTQEVAVDNRTSINVKLEAADTALDEVVVVGYGELRKRDLTGALSSIQSKDIVRANPVQAAKAIQGQVAGATVTKASNRPGAPYSITIRGENTINNSTQPLIVIDGLMGGDLNTLNPNDIQSMDVLKDASSTSIYGARGANGVVIVTTKKGISGKPKVSYDGYVGLKKIAHTPKLRTTQEFVKLHVVDRVAAGLSAIVFTTAETAKIDAGETTDWVDLITAPALQASHNISVSGGSDQTTYRFSTGYLDEGGNVKNTGFKRYNLNAGLDSKLGERFKVGFTSYATYSDQNWGSQESLRNAFRARPTGTVNYADLTNPSQNADLNIDGYAFWMGINDKQVGNPLLDIDPKNSKLQTTTMTAIANAYAEVTLMKGLTFRTSLSASYSTQKIGDWRGQWSKSQIGSNPRTQLDTWGMGNYTIDNIVNYNKEIGKHKFTVTALQSGFYQRDELTSTAVKDLPFNSYWYALNTGTITAQSSSLTERSLSSFMGRINYTFNDKYLVTVTGRSDGASQLAEGNKWAFFPSVALGWRMSDEHFIEKLNVFSNLKLRLSYGEVGNSTVNPYSTQAGLLNTGYDFDGTAANGFAPLNLANKSLKWERSKEVNLGLDFGFYNNRIAGSIELYNRKTVDLILNQKIPTSSGFNQVVANIGKIENKGIELTLNTINIRKTDFSWSTTFAFTKNKNKLLELYGEGLTADKGNKLFVGYPIRSNFDYEFAGIWQLADSNAAKGYTQVPGSVKVVDQNNDGKISSSDAVGDDRMVLGTQLPNWILGFTNRFNYKNFDLSFFLYYRNGVQYSNSALSGTFGELGARYNSLAELNYWTKDNPSNTYFSPFVANPYRGAINYQDASFLRVSDITVGYTLPKAKLEKWKLSNTRFYAQISNPFVFSNYIGFDPEFNSAIYKDDVPSAIYTLGFNISF